MRLRYVKQLARPELQFAHIRDEVTKQLKVVGAAHLYERDQVTQDFKHKPQFGYRIRLTQREIRLEILLKNPKEKVGKSWNIEKLWTALDEKGTRPHKIPKQRKPAGKWLRFTAGHYRPKTNPGGRFRGPGKVTGGKTVFAKQVRHPGFKPRHITRRINKDLRPLFLTQAERGYRIGHQRAIGLTR